MVNALDAKGRYFEAAAQSAPSQEIVPPLALRKAPAEVSYRLGFRPGDLYAGRHHKLTVKLARKADYCAGAAWIFRAEEVTNENVVADFPARIAVEPGKSK